MDKRLTLLIMISLNLCNGDLGKLSGLLIGVHQQIHNKVHDVAGAVLGGLSLNVQGHVAHHHRPPAQPARPAETTVVVVQDTDQGRQPQRPYETPQQVQYHPNGHHNPNRFNQDYNQNTGHNPNPQQYNPRPNPPNYGQDSYENGLTNVHNFANGNSGQQQNIPNYPNQYGQPTSLPNYPNNNQNGQGNNNFQPNGQHNPNGYNQDYNQNTGHNPNPHQYNPGPNPPINYGQGPYENGLTNVHNFANGNSGQQQNIPQYPNQHGQATSLPNYPNNNQNGQGNNNVQHNNVNPNNDGNGNPNNLISINHNSNGNVVKNPNLNDNYNPTETYNGQKHNDVHQAENTHKETNDKTTKKPVDDGPLFVPLNDYTYGGDKIVINPPKRDTDNKKQEESEEDFPIDIRFKDE